MKRIAIVKWDKLTEEARREHKKVYRDTWGWVHCPWCGQMMEISKKVHTIKDNGNMEPSLICPHCHFHEFVCLEGYAERRNLNVKMQ